MTNQQLLDYLPCVPDPDKYYYDIVQVSPMVQRVDLVHTYPYDYACGKPVSTVWGFIKSGKVHPPKNIKQMRPKSICPVEEAATLSGFTSVVPKCSSLLHIK